MSFSAEFDDDERIGEVRQRPKELIGRAKTAEDHPHERGRAEAREHHDSLYEQGRRTDVRRQADHPDLEVGPKGTVRGDLAERAPPDPRELRTERGPQHSGDRLRKRIPVGEDAEVPLREVRQDVTREKRL